MAWDLSNPNPGTRFDLPGNEGEFVELKALSDEENREVFKLSGIKFVKKQLHNKVDRKIEIVRDLDDDDEKQKKYSDEVNDRCIVDWLLFDPDGNKIPCTRENKITLMTKSPKFAAFVSEKLEELRASLSGKKEVELKN